MHVVWGVGGFRIAHATSIEAPSASTCYEFWTYQFYVGASPACTFVFRLWKWYICCAGDDASSPPKGWYYHGIETQRGPQATSHLGIQYRSLIERRWNRNVLLLSLLWPFAWLVAFLLILCTSWVPPHRVIRRAIQHGHLTAALLLMCNTTKYSTMYLPPYFATPMCSIVSKSLFF